MSCFISSGVQLGCSDGIGGIQKIYIVGGGGTVTGYTYDADGAITGATSTSGTTLYGFELKRNTSSLTQNIQKNFENGTIFFDQELLAVLFKYDQQKRNELKVLSQNDKLQIVAIDQNGTQYLLGQTNGMYLGSGAALTGVQFSDRNGFNLTFKGQEHEPANVINGALASVFTGASIVG
ncbi:YD repeat [uncultured Caudovirales phage]|uniref:YD repeat n=1 Tax=uncultured Caudovirales phage TaxID=2100421 RepID=A0A6J7WIF9_9CAUD|nr:YD repeat [uncultured Caudovirales phage]